MKILINALDDEPVMNEWLVELFKDSVYDLKVFSDPKQFIEAFTPDTDVIITDMRVPGYLLYNALEYFKTKRPYGLYIIVMSAYFDVEICERLFELDVDRIVQKGSTMDWMQKIPQYVNEFFPRISQRQILAEI
ncbi:MAG TPA: response regulator [Bacteroidia bacterium]|nr:response regulator [Bacteroidia bacterium]